MKIKKYLLISLIILVGGIASVFAYITYRHPSGFNQKSFRIPEGGKKIKENVYDYGYVEDSEGKKVQKVMTIYRAPKEPGSVKGISTDVLPATSIPCFNESIGGPSQPTRNYASHPLIFDPQNSSGLPQNDLQSTLNRSVYKWEGASKFGFLDNWTIGNLPANIANNPDGKNEIFFAAVTDSQLSDSLALTFSYFDSAGRISESDMVINDSKTFANNGDRNKYDFESVLTHETGHFAGLTDLTDSACSEEMMYGFQSLGEVKRNLTINDETSVYSLYHPPMSISNPPPFRLRYTTLEDSFVSSANPDLNFGNSDFVETNSSPNKSGFLKFDLLNLNGQSIAKATLNLRTADSSVNLQTVRQALSAWSEDGITYQNLPVIKSDIASFKGLTPNAWTTVDITSSVNNNKGKLVSLQINSGGSDNLSFMSLNSSVFAPYIEVEFANGQTNPKPGDCGGPNGNPDGFVDLFDYGNLSRSFGLTLGQSGFDGRCNFYQDANNIIDLFDFQILANNFGR